MTKRPVEAITFDFWDTIVVDDSDEPKRAAAGLPSKFRARRDLLFEFLNRHEPLDRAMTDLAYNVADAAFNKVWHDQHFTWTIGERLRVMLKGLNRTLPNDDFAELVRRHEEMELEYRPDPVPGVHEAIRTLAGKYKLAIVSDAIVSPARCLRELLRGIGILDCFSAFVFSDEAGCSKPAPGVFVAAAEKLGCSIPGIVHVGDREHNDVGGPHAVGARAVLLTAAKDRGSESSKADAVCRSFADLPTVIESLER
ncbi:MAG TPA: HAD family hydrolase [Candidatus Hydrogenedentes bacterium]|nr:HAD family hydrolase [Candidatus Hydrogenedentota bacterium]HQH54480.1 HAD family hydrolase [Candidatus Hydrogenedentota bacterium]HQM49428.1 HAD family hydrolase [Candidatus Hydrogenedentota bacterium]